jgi:uncharacterized protein (TIGR02001 family)
MKTSTTKLLFGLASAMTLLTSAALAEDSSDWDVSGYADVTSDYRFRGISQNNRNPSPEASINVLGPDGFYAGTWEAKTDWDGAGDPSFEADFYAGKHTDLYGTDLNVEAYYYAYPDAHFGVTASYYETLVQLAHSFDDLSLTLTGAWSPEWSLQGGNGYYVEGTISYAANGWLSISGNVGHQWVDAAASYGSSDYTHWDFGGTATYENWTLDVRYVDSSLTAAKCAAFWMGTKDACSATVTATLTYNIPSLF